MAMRNYEYIRIYKYVFADSRKFVVWHRFLDLDCNFWINLIFIIKEIQNNFNGFVLAVGADEVVWILRNNYF